MKNILKVCLIISILLVNVSTVSAFEFSKFILNSKLNDTSTIAVSVKEADSGKVVYQYNERKLLHPASTLKVFTTFPAMEAIGDNYNYTTTFYVYGDNLYIKLGADPLLTSQDIKEAVKTIKSAGYKTFKNIYFDSSITDNVEWGVGWMWDDGTNPLMPKFSAYNLDGNVMNISVSKDSNGSPTVTSSYSIPVLNSVKTGSANKLYAVRHDWFSPDVVCVAGTLATSSSLQVPINNMQRYFESRLYSYLNRSNIKIENKTILYAKTPQNAKEVTQIAHSVNATYDGIFKNSNNLYAENLAKIAGGVKTNSKANLAAQLSIFYDYWNAKGIDTTGITIADASGVSRNDLLTADFMTNALNSLYQTYGKDKVKSYFAQPGEGTLSERLLNYRGCVYLKTGTLSNISAITGYVAAENGKVYSIAILIQNFVYPMKEIKSFENSIIEKIIKL